MKIKSLIVLSLLVGALQFSPVLFGQDANQGGPGRGGRWQQRLANLSPEERERLKAARQKAMQDPAVQAAHEKMRQVRQEFMTSMHAAMLKADPSIQPVLNKIPRTGRGERDED
jgi:hypothetical protein